MGYLQLVVQLAEQFAEAMPFFIYALMRTPHGRYVHSENPQI